MKFEERLRAWTYRRQRLGRAAPDVDEALRDVIGVYSSHPSAPLSLWARTEGFTADAFRELDRERAMRVPAMRGSVHLMPRETAPLAFRAISEPGSRRAYVLEYFDLTEKQYVARRRKVVAAAAKEPLGSKELRKVTGVEKGSMLVSVMARDGVIRRIGADSLRSNSLRYVADEIPEADPDEGLAWLAGEYLRAFGPARVADFVWWSGAPAKRARKALATVDTIELEGGRLLPAEDEKAFEAVKPVPAGAVDVIPKWDAYTMGYPGDGRGRLVDDTFLDRAYDFRGDGMPLVLVGGVAAAAWSSRLKGKRMEVDLDAFGKPPAKVKRAIRERFEELAELMEAKELTLG